MPRRLEGRHQVAVRAGDVQFDGAALVVGSPLLRERLAVPRDVWAGETLDGKPAIHWCVPPDADKHGVTQDWARGGTGAQAFWRFLDLARDDANVPGAEFVAFAKRFGVLGLWDHRTPKGSKIFGIDYWPPSIAEGIYTPKVEWDHVVYYRLKAEGRHDEAERLTQTRYEPIAEWRRWAAWFNAALAITFDLRDGRSSRVQDWTALGWDIAVTVEDQRGGRRMVSVDLQRRELMRVIQGRFLKWSGLVPTIQWGDNGPGVSLALGGKDAIHMPRWSMQFDWPPNSLYPALVAQLIAVITAGPTAIATCDTCGRLHPRTRKVRADQPKYCDACKEDAIRETNARSAAKRRAEGRQT